MTIEWLVLSLEVADLGIDAHISLDAEPCEHLLRVEPDLLMEGGDCASDVLQHRLALPFDDRYEIEIAWPRRLLQDEILDETGLFPEMSCVCFTLCRSSPRAVPGTMNLSTR